VLEVIKLSARSSIRIPKKNIKTLEKPATAQVKEVATNSWSARDVKQPATLRSVACTGQKKWQLSL
jgi:hypothetical protein